MIKVKELRGYKSLRPINVYSALMTGLKMLPAHANDTLDEFAQKFEGLDEQAQEKVLREAILIVPLEPEEIGHLVSWCTDPNGVPYSAENVKMLTPSDLIDCTIAVCLEIARMKVWSVSETEKKKS